MEKRSESGFFGAMSLVAAVAVMLLLAGLWIISIEGDAATKAREQAVVGNGMQARILEIAAAVTPLAIWDEAVSNLDLKFNKTWADHNIGAFLGGIDSFNIAMVLDGRDQPIYGWKDGAARDPESLKPVAEASAGLIAKVRQAEAQRAPLPRPDKATGMVSKPIQANDIRRIGGAPYIVTATLVQPDSGRVVPSRRSAIVVTGRSIDAGFLAAFAPRYMLNDLVLARTQAPKSAGVVLRSATGEAIGILQWSPRAPGAALLARGMYLVLALAMGLIVVISALWRNAARANRQLIESEARAKHMAVHDALTDLPNRTLFRERLDLALEGSRRSGEPLAVLCVDLDRFKLVNDTYGHSGGDELIREAARRLSATCRAGETVARLGGDEFAILQPKATPQSAARLAERIQQTVIGPVDISGGRVFLACSTGATVLQAGDADPNEVLRQADLALYAAKDQGRGGFRFFEPEMDTALRVRREIETDLRMAIGGRQLKMVYQPQVDGRQEIVGLEALLRWNHPTRGQVSPAFFVPIAEECGVMDALGFFTLRAAFTDSLRWPQLKMAVNVSASQLRLPDFLDRLKSLVKEVGVNPANLDLEITEGILLGDAVEIHTTLAALREMGFGLALDDFGTGYSSLSYLRQFPVSKIKIDRSFISNLGIDAQSDEMVSAMVRLARALNLGVIAEGVETDEQRRRLVLAGCGDLQGFLFGRPSSREVIDRIMAAA